MCKLVLRRRSVNMNVGQRAYIQYGAERSRTVTQDAVCKPAHGGGLSASAYAQAPRTGMTDTRAITPVPQGAIMKTRSGRLLGRLPRRMQVHRI
jgi:hypothetical protein